MHSLRSAQSLLAFRLGACGLLVLAADIFASAVLGSIGLLTHDPTVLRCALWALAGLPLAGLLYLFFAIRARCPLCMNPPLLARGCQKHHSAGTFVRSYRLRVGVGVMFANHFTCPYCGELTRCAVRGSRRNRA